MRRYYKRRGSGGGWTLFPWPTRQESFRGRWVRGGTCPRLVLVPAWGMRSGHAGKVVAAQLDWRGLRFGGRVLVGVGQGMCRRWPGATPAWTPEDQPHRDPDRGPKRLRPSCRASTSFSPTPVPSEPGTLPTGYGRRLPATRHRPARRARGHPWRQLRPPQPVRLGPSPTNLVPTPCSRVRPRPGPSAADSRAGPAWAIVDCTPMRLTSRDRPSGHQPGWWPEWGVVNATCWRGARRGWQDRPWGTRPWVRRAGYGRSKHATPVPGADRGARRGGGPAVAGRGALV